MCIAVIKPKGVPFPLLEQFENCFNSNPHGAGFMYAKDGMIVLKKGFDTFDSFMEALRNEHLSIDNLVFFHFRIATHGLVDGGNTHPFPITDNINILRKTELKYKGYGLIHNGILHYPQEVYDHYDPNGIISDTMLLSIKINEYLNMNNKQVIDLESAIAYHLKTKNKDISHYIEEELMYNKVAIMNENEEYVKYGNWIEDHGVFYSNSDYKYSNSDYKYSNYNCYDGVCCICGQEIDGDYEVCTEGNICNNCLQDYEFTNCANCGVLIFDDDGKFSNLCDCCIDSIRQYECEQCFQPLEESIFLDEETNEVLCRECYNIRKEKEIIMEK